MINKHFSTPYASVGRGNGLQVSYQNCFDRFKPVRKFKGKFLPHWQQDNCLTYITLRLADSLPHETLITYKELKTDLQQQLSDCVQDNIDSDYNIELITRIDKWLDKGCGDCILMDEGVRDIVVNALEYYDGKRYELFEYVVMPNHLHVIMIPYVEESIVNIIEDFKRFTTIRINKYTGSRGRVWQSEMFDHLIRSITEYEETADYIRNNPLKK